MQCQCKDLMVIFEEIAPARLAEPWDNTGLLVGAAADAIKGILVTLDVTREVVMEAAQKDAQLILSHHPILLQGTKSILKSQYEGAIIYELVKNDIALYVMHTNFDAAKGGVNDCLAQALGLKDISVLKSAPAGAFLKLVVFAPESSAEGILQALNESGAGQIGGYSHCSFSTRGTGTFLPGEKTHPYTGKRGELCRADEVRMETIVPVERAAGAVAAMLKAHPYEEPAYDLYPLALAAPGEGLGRVGFIEGDMDIRAFSALACEKLGATALRVFGDMGKRIQKAAVCCGSGGELIETAASSGADVFLTGDIKHHDALKASGLGLALIAAGHYHTERVAVRPLIARLQSRADKLKYNVEIIESEIDTGKAQNFVGSPV